MIDAQNGAYGIQPDLELRQEDVAHLCGASATKVRLVKCEHYIDATCIEAVLPTSHKHSLDIYVHAAVSYEISTSLARYQGKIL